MLLRHTVVEHIGLVRLGFPWSFVMVTFLADKCLDVTGMWVMFLISYVGTVCASV